MGAAGRASCPGRRPVPDGSRANYLRFWDRASWAEPLRFARSRSPYGIQNLQCLRKQAKKFMCQVGRFATLRNDRCGVFFDSLRLRTLIVAVPSRLEHTGTTFARLQYRAVGRSRLQIDYEIILI